MAANLRCSTSAYLNRRNLTIKHQSTQPQPFYHQSSYPDSVDTAIVLDEGSFELRVILLVIGLLFWLRALFILFIFLKNRFQVGQTPLLTSRALLEPSSYLVSLFEIAHLHHNHIVCQSGLSLGTANDETRVRISFSILAQIVFKNIEAQARWSWTNKQTNWVF